MESTILQGYENTPVVYRDCKINPLEFWAMLLDTAAIDGYGHELGANSVSIMDDNFRFTGGEHRRWPLYCLHHRTLGSEISQAECDRLPPEVQRQFEHRTYFDILDNNGHLKIRRYYYPERYPKSEELEDIDALIEQVVLSGNMPVIRVVKELHGQDEVGNKPGRLYQYRRIILKALRKALREGRYQQTGLTEALSNQVEHGYIGWVEHYHLAWLQTIADGVLQGDAILGLGATELNLLRRFVTASSEDLTDWFGQSLDAYQTTEGEYFPSVVDGKIVQLKDRWQRHKIYSIFTDGQLQYLTEIFQPVIVLRLMSFFGNFSSALENDSAAKDVISARYALKNALVAVPEGIHLL